MIKCSICGKDCTNNYWEFADEQDKFIIRCPTCAVDYKDEKIIEKDDHIKELGKELKKVKQAFLLACKHLAQVWFGNKMTAADWKNFLLDKAIEKESDLK